VTQHPAPFLDDPALGKIWDMLPDARVVGGAVRDALANRPVADIDLATPQAPDAVQERLTGAGVKVIPTGLAHGTVTAVVDGHAFEVTTLRRDVETDGRHAVVVFTDDWQQDAARRDFTFNAMSMARDGTLFDYFGGVTDLAAGRVRFVGDPVVRIAEDYLRLLRFFRFYARFGDVPPDPETVGALQGGIPGLGRLSAERVWHELRLILVAPNPAQSIALMDRVGVWPAVLTEADATAFRTGLPADPILRLAGMLHNDPERIAQRLKLSNAERDRLVRLLATPPVVGSDDALRRLLADHDPADLIGRTWLDDDADARTRVLAMPRPVFPLEGRDALEFGVPAGPGVGMLLRAVRGWWLENGCVGDRAACLGELARAADTAKMSEKR
jgi:poly(A) polymerase/tRNA nucleotidyltransferase (CCA-adding enzyme)